MTVLHNIELPTLPTLPEPRSPQEAWRLSKKAEFFGRIAERGEKLFDPLGKTADSTTGYAAVVNPDGTVKVGKPRPKESDGDYTEADGGPYTVDIQQHTCTCPFFPAHRFCKHQYGLLYALATYPYRIAPSGRIVFDMSSHQDEVWPSPAEMKASRHSPREVGQDCNKFVTNPPLTITQEAA